MACTTGSNLHRQSLAPPALMLRPVSRFFGRSSAMAFRHVCFATSKHVTDARGRNHARMSAGTTALLIRPAPAVSWRSQQRDFSLAARAASAEPTTVTGTGVRLWPVHALTLTLIVGILTAFKHIMLLKRANLTCVYSLLCRLTCTHRRGRLRAAG